MNSSLGKTFLFLTNLAYKSRITLPILITAGFMILNFRWEVEINIHTEQIGIQEAQAVQQQFRDNENSMQYSEDDDDEDGGGEEEDEYTLDEEDYEDEEDSDETTEGF